MSFIDDLKLRCKKCNVEFFNKDLIKGYCSKCIGETDYICRKCHEPISKGEHYLRQGMCKACQWTWLRSNHKINADVDIYPGTGV